eukprot:410434-Prymnesium_polylepis.1
MSMSSHVQGEPLSKARCFSSRSSLGSPSEAYTTARLSWLPSSARSEKTTEPNGLRERRSHIEVCATILGASLRSTRIRCARVAVVADVAEATASSNVTPIAYS